MLFFQISGGKQIFAGEFLRRDAPSDAADRSICTIELNNLLGKQRVRDTAAVDQSGGVNKPNGLAGFPIPSEDKE